MRISYDAEIDALYIRLIEGPQECRTVRLNDEVALNIGPGETLVGIEILDAKQVLGRGQLPAGGAVAGRPIGGTAPDLPPPPRATSSPRPPRRRSAGLPPPAAFRV